MQKIKKPNFTNPLPIINAISCQFSVLNLRFILFLLLLSAIPLSSILLEIKSDGTGNFSQINTAVENCSDGDT